MVGEKHLVAAVARAAVGAIPAVALALEHVRSTTSLHAALAHGAHGRHVAGALELTPTELQVINVNES